MEFARTHDPFSLGALVCRRSGLSRRRAAHLYINGEKVARLYGPWYHIAYLEPGKNEILVTLNANNHGEYLHDGEVIADTVTVYVVD